MASFLTNAHAANGIGSRLSFAELWAHYEQAQFLYPAKLDYLLPLKAQIGQVWTRLLEAPAGLFQAHFSRVRGDVVSSVSAVRDTDDRFIIQHAASVTHPELLVECLLSITTAMCSSTARTACIYYRPANKWPARLRKTVGARQPSALQDQTVQEYLTARPVSAPWPRGVELLDGSLPSAALHLMRAKWGALRLDSLGFRDGRSGLNVTSDAYADAGLRRERRVLGVVREERLAGLAVIHLGTFPLNLSFLCNRVEIVVAPDAPERNIIACALLVAAQNIFTEARLPFCTALVDAEEIPAAVAAGFTAKGRQYANFLWAKEDERGYPSSAIAVSEWYSVLSRLRERKAED